MKHPMQPMEKDKHGVIRFKANKIVEYLFDKEIIDLNNIARIGFPQEDMEQFWQLLGYSVSGYGDLSFISDETIAKADELASRL